MKTKLPLHEEIIRRLEAIDTDPGIKQIHAEIANRLGLKERDALGLVMSVVLSIEKACAGLPSSIRPLILRRTYDYARTLVDDKVMKIEISCLEEAAVLQT